jgi:hypothetical protein
MTPETAYLVAGLALALLALAMWLPSLVQRARREAATRLADDGWLDEDHDRAMREACERELASARTPVFDALWIEALSAALEQHDRRTGQRRHGRYVTPGDWLRRKEIMP